MKNLDLNNCGVQEMNAEEMRKTEGGILPILLALGILLVVGTLINIAIYGDL